MVADGRCANETEGPSVSPRGGKRFEELLGLADAFNRKHRENTAKGM